MDHSFQWRNLGSRDVSLCCPASHFSGCMVYRYFVTLCRSWTWMNSRKKNAIHSRDFSLYFVGFYGVRQQEAYFHSSNAITQIQTVLDCLHVNSIFLHCISCDCRSINWILSSFHLYQYSFYNNPSGYWILNSILNVRQLYCQGQPTFWWKCC